MKPTSINHSIDSSTNNFPELVTPYIYFSNIKALLNYFEYSGKQSAYLLSNFTNTLFLTFSCKNDPIKSNWCTLSLFLIAPSKKYF